MYSVKCTMYSVKYTIYSVQCMFIPKGLSQHALLGKMHPWPGEDANFSAYALEAVFS